MPATRLKSGSKVLKKSKRHDTSTPIKNSKASSSQVSKSKGHKITEKNVRNQYKIAAELDRNTRYCKFSAKQTRTWKPLDRETRQHLYSVIDSAVKTVGSKPVFVGDDDVQALLSQLKLKLKSKLHSVRVPKQRGRSATNLRTKMTQQQEEAERLKLQTSELEREIRQEERRIEALEDARLLQSSTRTQMSLQINPRGSASCVDVRIHNRLEKYDPAISHTIPENELDLAAIVFYNT